MSEPLRALVYFVAPVLLTAVIEALTGILFKLSKKEQIFLLLINIATNLSLNLLLYLYRLYLPWHDAFAIIPLEIAIIIAEWRLMLLYSPDRRSGNCFLLSLACNAASYSFGALILPLILS